MAVITVTKDNFEEKVVNAEGNKLEIIFDKYGHKKLHKDYVNKID